jgi:glycosyltransferase involved in cell wall biosynthesis
VTVLCFADTRFPIERANGVQTIETCHALARRGHEVTLVVRPDTAPAARDPLEFYGLPPAPNLRIMRIAATGPARIKRLRFLLGILPVATADRKAVVLTRDLGAAALLLQLPKSRRPRVVYESHGVSTVVAREMATLLGKPELAPSAAKLRRLDRRERLVWRQAAAYVTITRALATELAGTYGQRPNVFVVPDGARERPEVPLNDSGRFIAGYAGHLYPWKGVDIFVRALAHAHDVDGLIVGGHPGEADLMRVTALVRDLGLEQRVRITGLLAPAEVAASLAPASVLVLPNPPSAISERYTSPLKLFDYLTIGRAIVASDLLAIREILDDGTTAMLVPAGDERALAAALTELQADPARTAALARGARALAARYTWDARAERIEAALEAARS